jgi:hypothetical protein
MNPSLECELTRVQMKRYLAGEELPEPLMEELEQHVHVCGSCRHYLDTQKLKLAAKLSGAKAEKVKAPVEPKGPKDSDVFHAPKQKLFTPKTLGLAAALALVLFAMSAVAKDPTIIFGRKASTALSAGDKEKPTDEQGTDEETTDPHEGEEDSSHKKVGEIMTGETVRKELEEKEAAEAAKAAEEKVSHSSGGHEEADSAHSAKPELVKEEPKPAAHDESHAADAAHETKTDSSHASKPETPQAKAPKKPDMALVVAEHGKTKKEPAPKPRPSTAKASSSKPRVSNSAKKRRSTAQRSSAKRSSAPKKSSAQRPSGSGSIKIYDSQGRPVN